MAKKAELVVTSGTDCPETYLRIGSWKDDANEAASQVAALKEKADTALSNPSSANVGAVLDQLGGTAEGASWVAENGAALRQAVDDRDLAQTERGQKLSAYNAAREAYTAPAAAAQAAYEALSAAKTAYEEAKAAGRPETELVRLRKAYEAAKSSYDAAETTHQEKKTALHAAEGELIAAQETYQASKASLTSSLAQAFSVGQQATVDAANLSPVMRKRGDDLAARIVDFFDDTRKRGPFTDLSVAERKAESKLLHDKGGWRDHTEGNRISTTRGDKIEVIRGNYRRLVMGRQDQTDNGALLDASGGIYRDGDFAPGSVVLVEHSTIWDGDTWLSKEETSKGNVESYYHGNVKEAFYGEKVETYVGQGAGTWDDAATKHPIVIEKSWVKSIQAETHVDEGVSDSTSVTGTLTESTTARDIRSTTTAHSSIHDFTHVGAGVVEILTVGAGVVEINTIGASHIELEAATTHISFELSPFSADMFIGAARFEANIVGAIIAFDAGKRLELQVAGGLKLTPADEELSALKTKVDGIDTTVNTTSTKLAAAETKLATAVSDLATTRNELSTLDTKVAAMHSLI